MGSRARAPSSRYRDGHHSNDRQAEDRVEDEAPAQLPQRGSEQDRPEDDEGDPVEYAPDLLSESVQVLGIALDHRPEDDAGDECRDEARPAEGGRGAIGEDCARGRDHLAPAALDHVPAAGV